jgi:zinc-binding in reverse transcriptase
VPYNIFSVFMLHSESNDVLLWRCQNVRMFSVHYLYSWLEFAGITNTEYMVMWKINIPLKIKIFVWLVRRNRVLTKVNLVKKMVDRQYSMYVLW